MKRIPVKGECLSVKLKYFPLSLQNIKVKSWFVLLFVLLHRLVGLAPNDKSKGGRRLFLQRSVQCRSFTLKEKA